MMKKTISLREWFDAALAGDVRRPGSVRRRPDGVTAEMHSEHVKLLDISNQGEKMENIIDAIEFIGEPGEPGEYQNAVERERRIIARLQELDQTMSAAALNDIFSSRQDWACMAHAMGLAVGALLIWEKEEWFAANMPAADKETVRGTIEQGIEKVNVMINIAEALESIEAAARKNLMRRNLLVLVLAGRRRGARDPPPEVLAWMTEEFA
jgi:hypothetical protein